MSVRMCCEFSRGNAAGRSWIRGERGGQFEVSPNSRPVWCNFWARLCGVEVQQLGVTDDPVPPNLASKNVAISHKNKSSVLVPIGPSRFVDPRETRISLRQDRKLKWIIVQVHRSCPPDQLRPIYLFPDLRLNGAESIGCFSTLFFPFLLQHPAISL